MLYYFGTNVDVLIHVEEEGGEGQLQESKSVNMVKKKICFKDDSVHNSWGTHLIYCMSDR